MKGYQTQWSSLGFFLGGICPRVSSGFGKANPSETEDLSAAGAAPVSYPPHPQPAAVDTVNQQKVLIIHADPGISQGLPPTCRTALSDVIGGELPALCVVSTGFPQGPRCGSTSPAYLQSTPLRPSGELAGFLFKAIFNQRWRELAAPAQTAEERRDIRGNSRRGWLSAMTLQVFSVHVRVIGLNVSSDSEQVLAQVLAFM